MDSGALSDDVSADPRKKTRRLGLFLGLVVLVLLVGPIALKTCL